MTHSRLESALAAMAMLAAVATAVFAFAPSQADIETCNRMAAAASLRTAKGSHASNQDANTAQRGQTAGQQRDGKRAISTPDTIGMAPAGETDGVYRQAYTSCMNQRAGRS